MGNASGDRVKLKVYMCPTCEHAWLNTNPPPGFKCPDCGCLLQKKRMDTADYNMHAWRELTEVYRCPECYGVVSHIPDVHETCEKCHVYFEKVEVPKDASNPQWHTETPVEERAPDGIHPLEGNPYDVDQVINHALKFADAVNHAAFRGQEIAESLSDRDPNAPEEYVDKVEFDAKQFNRRASMVADMIATRELLRAAGLKHYERDALLRILDAKITPRVQVFEHVPKETGRKP